MGIAYSFAGQDEDKQHLGAAPRTYVMVLNHAIPITGNVVVEASKTPFEGLFSWHPNRMGYA